MKKQNVTHGTIYLMFAQAAFVASGYAIHIGLARLLGPSDYGIYAVVISLMTMVNLILTTGIPQAVSKYVAHDDGGAEEIKKTALKMQLVFSLAIFLVYFLLAEQIALLLNDASLTPYLRASSFIVPGYAVYSILVGYLNGLREYQKQAITAVSYSIFKAVFILAMVLAGYAVIGAVVGFVFAPIAGLLVAVYFTRHGKIGERLPILAGNKVPPIHEIVEDTLNRTPSITVKQIMDFAVPIALFSVATNLIMSVDLFFVKAYLTNYDTGIYSAASMIARVPFFLIGGLYGALFPAISNSTASNNIEKTRKYISQSLKYSLMAMVPAVVIISAMADKILPLVYSGEYAGGAQVLSILVVGLGFYSLFFLFTTILNGSGRPRDSLILGVVVLGLDVLLNFMLVPRYEMIGAAVATGGACLVGFVVSGGGVYRRGLGQ
jgi:O-antigen/teichoic acid export membrane protein